MTFGPHFTSITRNYLTVQDADGNRVLVDIQSIQMVAESPAGGCLVILNHGAQVAVKQGYDDISRILFGLPIMAVMGGHQFPRGQT